MRRKPSTDIFKIETLDDIINKRDEMFKSSFWVDKITFISVYQYLQQVNTKISIRMLALFFNFLKEYPTIRHLANCWGMGQQTIVQTIQTIIEAFLILMERYKWNNKERLNHKPLIVNGISTYCAIDSSSYEIQKPSLCHEYEKQFYSPKHGFHCIKIEAAVCIDDGTIIWVSPEFYLGTQHDLSISRESGIMDSNIFKLEDNERILADLGYIGEPDVFLTPDKGHPENLSYLENILNSFKHKYRSIVENLYGRQKSSLGILRTAYRGDIDDFGNILQIIYWITAILLQNNPLRRAGNKFTKYNKNKSFS